MKKRSFWSVMLVAIIGISLSGCASPVLLKKEETATPPALAKVVAPETKKEIPVVTAPAPEVKMEAPSQSVPTPAPKKKKKG